MIQRAIPLSLALLLAAPFPAMAQDTATETPTETVQTGEEPNPATDLNMGTEVSEGPKAGQPYIRAEHGDWALRCIKAPEGQKDPCQLYQLLNDEKGNPVAEFSMFPLANGGKAAAGATIVVPLETLLTTPLRLSVDGGPDRVYPYSFCNRAGCVARVGLTPDDVNAFKAGAKAKLSLVPAAAPDQVVKLDLSLLGFTAGYTATDAQ